MTKEETLRELRERTKADPVLDATMHVLAMRRRPRHNLTIDGLYYRMRREGFNHPKKDYARVFKLLGELGLARVLTNLGGDPQEAKDFRMPLPLIGMAACGSPVPADKIGKLLSKAEPRVPKPGPPTPQKHEMPSVEHFIAREPRSPRSYQTPGSRLILTVLVNEKPINIPVPKSLTPDELSALITELWELSAGLDEKYGKK